MRGNPSRSQHSISCLSQSSFLNLERVRSTELVLVEQDAHQIQSRLDEAQQRLRWLSSSTQSSVRELKRLFGTADKRKSHLRNKSATAAGGGHLHAIRHHLNMLEQQAQHEPEGSTWLPNEACGESADELSPAHQQSQLTTKMDWPKRQPPGDDDDAWQLRNELKQLRKQHHSCQRRIEELEAANRGLQEQHREELREGRLDFEHERLRAETELLNEIDSLSRKLSAAAKQQQRSQELQFCNDRLQAQNTSLRETARIERNLKVESMNRTKDLEQELKLARQNNERMAQQVNDLVNQLAELRPQAESHARDAVWLGQTLIYSAEILNRLGNGELPATVVMIKEELNLKKSSIRRLAADLRGKYQLDTSDVAGSASARSGLFRLRHECHQPPNKFRRFISGDDSNKQNCHSNSTVERRSSADVLQQAQPSPTPFLEQLTSIFASEQTDLYMMLLAQAAELERSLQEVELE